MYHHLPDTHCASAYDVVGHLGYANARPLCATSTGVPPAACCITRASSSSATSLSWRTQSP
jgi:hypothetical protein